MSDKTVVELKVEAKLKKIKGFSKMNRGELCKVLGYENCGKRVSVKKASPKQGKVNPEKQAKKASPKQKFPGKKTKKVSPKQGKVNPEKQAKKTSPKKTSPKKVSPKKKTSPKKVRKVSPAKTKQAQMKIQKKNVKKMVDAKVYTFEPYDKELFLGEMKRFITDLALYMKNDKESKAKGKYYFNNEIDSNTTAFENLSNQRLLGVQAESKEKGLILLWLLELLYDYKEWMENDYPIWVERRDKTESKHNFALNRLFGGKFELYFMDNDELDLEGNEHSATGAELMDAIVNGRNDYATKIKVKEGADIWSGERIYREMKKLKII